jgi:hypothetical protein
LRRPCPGRRGSAFRVWLPSGRLTPSAPLPVLFHTSGAPGIYPSELPPPTRYPVRFRPEGPTYRLSCLCYRCRNSGPAGQAAVSGLQPLRESLVADVGLARRVLAAPLGFALLGFAGGSLVRGFTWTPPARFIDPTLRPAPVGASESRSASAWSRPVSGKPGTGGTALLGFSHRTVPDIGASCRLGY